MHILLDVLLGIASGIVVLLWGLSEFGGILSDICDDLRNRNDRGKLKKPSDKFVR